MKQRGRESEREGGVTVHLDQVSTPSVCVEQRGSDTDDQSKLVALYRSGAGLTSPLFILADLAYTVLKTLSFMWR